MVAWLLVVLSLAGPVDAQDPVAGLRRAATAYRKGQFARCAELAAGLDRDALQNPDVALLIEGQCRFYAGEPGEARASFDRLVHAHPASLHRGLAEARRADCDWETGHRKKAVRAYARTDEAPDDPRTDRAVGLARRLRWHLERDTRQKIARLWKRLRVEHPAHPLAARYPGEDPAPSMTTADALDIAGALHGARRWETALAVLDAAPAPADRRKRYRMAWRSGRILFDMRDHYDRAAKILQAARDHASSATEDEQAWFYLSRALGRLDRDEEAVRSHLEMVKRYPHGKHAARALYYAGWLEQNQDHCEKALPILERVWTTYPDSRWSPPARWTAAWCRLTAHEWKRAIRLLAPQLAGRRSGRAGRALYWTGVAREALGQHDRARTAWRRTIQRFPLTWYALLARVRLGAGAPTRPGPPPARPIEPVPSPLLARAAELVEAGLSGYASALLRHGEDEYLARHPGRRALLTLMDAYRRAGDFNRPWLLALRHALGSLRRLPDRASRAFWDHNYPRCERDLLRRHAGGDEQLVLFLQGIMRTESGFDPQALSVANARGLMQMIPPNASRVAAELGIDHHDDRLFDPDYNIRIAAWYAGRLVHKFRRQWPLAAAAYNAGAPAVMTWCREIGHLPLDAFVESIPWSESRRYTKRVTKAFARYAYLEGRSPPALRLEIDPDYVEDDIDF